MVDACLWTREKSDVLVESIFGSQGKYKTADDTMYNR
jgi:hypothetical protein